MPAETAEQGLRHTDRLLPAVTENFYTNTPQHDMCIIYIAFMAALRLDPRPKNMRAVGTKPRLINNTALPAKAVLHRLLQRILANNGSTYIQTYGGLSISKSWPSETGKLATRKA